MKAPFHVVAMLLGAPVLGREDVHHRTDAWEQGYEEGQRFGAAFRTGVALHVLVAGNHSQRFVRQFPWTTVLFLLTLIAWVWRAPPSDHKPTKFTTRLQLGIALAIAFVTAEAVGAPRLPPRQADSSNAATARAPNQPMTDAHCRASILCSEEGECTASGGRCIATRDDDCRASDDCSWLGKCFAVDSECKARRISDCVNCKACGKYGWCNLKEGRCVGPD